MFFNFSCLLKNLYRNRPPGSKGTKFPLRIAVLFAIMQLCQMSFSMELFSQNTPDFWGSSRRILDYQFDRADREMSPDRWIEEARRGIINAQAVLAEIVPEVFFSAEGRAEFAEWSEQELENRFTRWLLERFFGAGIEATAATVFREAGEAQKFLIYHTGPDGNILYDPRTGDPLIIRPGDEAYEFTEDLFLYRQLTQNAAAREEQNYRYAIKEMYPELLAYIAPGRGEEFEKKLLAAGERAVLSLRHEFEAILARGERYFTAQRLGDVWSLRKKSDDQSAEAIGDRLIEEARRVCADGIAAIEARIEAAAVSGEDLTLAGFQWLEEYRIQFERGLNAWQSAEERFLIRRIEWEQSANKAYHEGWQTWNAVFARFEEERRLWEEKAAALFLEGEQFFASASESLEAAIVIAKAQFEKDSRIRVAAVSDRAGAIANMYVISSSAAEEARKNMEFWTGRYLEIQPGANIPTGETALISWIDGELRRLGGRGLEAVILEELKTWVLLHRSYTIKAEESRQQLMRELSSLAGFWGSQSSGNNFFPDDYETELIRAEGELEYWKKRTALAELVAEYAAALDAGRITAAESTGAWEAARIAYNEAALYYGEAEGSLTAKSADISAARDALAEAAEKMKAADAALEKLRQNYQLLSAAFGSQGATIIMQDLAVLSRELAAEQELLGRNDENSPWGAFLASARLLEARQLEELRKEILRQLTDGDGDRMEPLLELSGSELELRLAAISLLTGNGSAADWYFSVYKIPADERFAIPNMEEQLFMDWMWNQQELLRVMAKYELGELDYPDLIDYINREEFSGALYNIYLGFGNISPVISRENLERGLTQLERLWNALGAETENLIIPRTDKIISALIEIDEDINSGVFNLIFILNEIFFPLPSWLDLIFSMWKESLVDYCASPGTEALVLVERHGNILNAALLSLRNGEHIGGSFDDYEAAYLKLLEHYSREKFIKGEIARLAAIAETASQGLAAVEREMAAAAAAIALAEEERKAAGAAYQEAADNFRRAGEAYDALYEKAEMAFKNLEEARWDFDTQDALRLWASTAYLDSRNPADELRRCLENLNRAAAVVEMLKSVQPSGNQAGEYADAYKQYQDSLSLLVMSLDAQYRLERAIQAEREKNESLYRAYQNQLSMFGQRLYPVEGYVSPQDKALWNIMDMINVDQGYLIFARDNNFVLSGCDQNRSRILTEFFSQNKTIAGEPYPVSSFDIALRELAKKLDAAVNSRADYENLGLARDYLIKQILLNNPGLGGTQDWYRIAEALNKDQNLGNMIIYKPLARESLHEILHNFLPALDNHQKNAWDSLDAETKRILEFYTILTLTGGGGNNSGYFSKVSDIQVYRGVLNIVDFWYEYYRQRSSVPVSGLFYRPGYQTNQATRNALLVPLEELDRQISMGFHSLTGTLASIDRRYIEYKQSSDRLSMLTGMTPGIVRWEDIERALSLAGGLAGNLNPLKELWEKIRNEPGNDVRDVSSALRLLADASKKTKEESFIRLDQIWKNAEDERKIYELSYRKLYDSYMTGETNLNDLKAAAVKSFGGNVPLGKKHLENIGNALMEAINLFSMRGLGGTAECAQLAVDYAGIVNRAWEEKYAAELKVRENEWDLQRRDIQEKLSLWRGSADVILEQGRKAWKEGGERLLQAGNLWVRTFEDEYKRINDQWTAAYLEGLRDKEAWAASALEAASYASSAAAIAMIGSGAEAGARLMDTRDSLGFMNFPDLSEGERILAELLEKSGTSYLAAAFASIRNSGESLNFAARTGIHGGGVWNSGTALIEASVFARTVREEFETRESQKMAYMVMNTATDVYRMLEDNLKRANDDFKKNMDEVFIIGGQWRRSGTNYIKDVIVHSTFVSAIITEYAEVEGYMYFLFPQTSLSVYMNGGTIPSNLNVFQAQRLIDSIYSEINHLGRIIFGSGTDDDGGLFSIHIGDQPIPGSKPDIEKGREGIIDVPGSGELGRLLTEFYFWMVKESQGISLVSIASWDKPLWDSRNSAINAPSLRSSADLALQTGILIAGAAGAPFTGGASVLGSIALNAALGSADDLLFSALDVTWGHKTWAEAGTAFGKSLLTNTVNSAAGSLFFGPGGFSELFANHGLGGAAHKTLTSGLHSISTGSINSLLASVNYDTSGGFGFSTDSFLQSLKSSSFGALSSMTGTLVGGILDLGLTGFTGNIYNDGRKLSNLAGGLASQGVSYALGNDFVLNIFNAGLFFDNVNAGLVEMHLGRNGISFGLGSGGADASIGTLFSALKGIEAWKANAQIFFSSEDIGKYASALRTLYSGDNINRNEFHNILAGDTKLVETDARFTQSIYDPAAGIKTIYLGTGAFEDGGRFFLNYLLSHESYRDGMYSGESGQAAELEAAVRGHNRTALELINTYGLGSLSGDIIAEALFYQFASSVGSTAIIEMILDNYDNSADFWKLVKNDRGFWFWEDDRSADFDISDLLLEYDYVSVNFARDDILRAVHGSNVFDGKDHGIISAGRMTRELAHVLGYSVVLNNYNTTGLLFPAGFQGNHFTTHNPLVIDTLAKIAFNAAHTTTIYDQLGRPVTLHNLNRRNDVAGEILKQNSPSLSEIENMAKYGCNFMFIISLPQILTKQAMNAQQVTEIWNQAVERNIIRADGFVNNRNALANLALEKLGITNFGIDLTETRRNSTVMGYRVQVPYGSTGHFVLTGTDRSLAYNPGNTFTSDQSKWKSIVGVAIYGR